MSQFEITTKEEFDAFLENPNVHRLDTVQLVQDSVIQGEVVFYSIEDGYGVVRIVGDVIEMTITEYGSEAPEVFEHSRTEGMQDFLLLLHYFMNEAGCDFYWEPGLTIEN